MLILLNSNYLFSYRQVTRYGQDTIRKFDTNVSAMKKLVAHDWEDLLQVILNIILQNTKANLTIFKCAIPVFEGLLSMPAHDTLV